MKRRMTALVTAAVLGCTTLLPVTASADIVAETRVTAPMVAPLVPVEVPEGMSVAMALGAQPAGLNVSEQQAIEIIRSAFPHLIHNGEPQLSLNEDDYRGRMVWRIYMHESTPSRLFTPGPSGGFNATVDAVTGEVLDMHQYQSAPPAQTETKGVLSREQARRIAEETARRLQPEKFAQLRLNEELSEYAFRLGDALILTHTFHWERVFNGIPVSEDGLHITVNSLSGQVTGYHFVWGDDLQLPAAEAVVPTEGLAAEVVGDVGMVLVYQVFPRFMPHSVPKVQLAYQLNSGHAGLVDAMTGGYLNIQGQPVDRQASKLYENYDHIRGVMNPPAPPEQVSQAQAREAVAGFLALLGIEGKVEKGGSGSSSGPLGNREYWYFNVMPAGEGGVFPSSVGIDTSTGRVVSYNRHDYYGYPAEIGVPSLSRKEALAKAEEFIRKVVPEYAGHVVLANDVPGWYEMRGGTYSFRFIRVANGVPFPMDGMHVQLSGDGRVVGYNCDWHRVDFPVNEGVITPEAAAEKWLQHADYRLRYFIPRTFDGRRLVDEAKLVYQLGVFNVQAIDAFTGQALGFDGSPVEGQGVNGYDFTGSWAAQSLELLAGSGLLPPPGEFVRNAPVMRRNAVRVATASTRVYYGGREQQRKPSFQDVAMSDRDFDTVERAVDAGIIVKAERFYPDQALTRKELAAWLVNAAGYREVAGIVNRITAPFDDLDTLSGPEQNYIGLAYGFGFMRGDGSSRFRPDDAVTWEELAAAIFKALPKISGRDY